MNKKTVKMVLDGLTSVATQQVRNAGKITIPGLCRIKARVQNGSEPTERHLFGRIIQVRARPPQTIVTANGVMSFKKSI